MVETMQGTMETVRGECLEGVVEESTRWRWLSKRSGGLHKNSKQVRKRLYEELVGTFPKGQPALIFPTRDLFNHTPHSLGLTNRHYIFWSCIFLQHRSANYITLPIR